MNLQTNFFKKVLFVIVLYKQELLDSETYLSLKSSIVELSYSNQLTLYIYDNSPKHEKNDYFNNDFKIIFSNDISNPGLSKAYKNAFDYSIENNYSWVLLLDQDSTLNPNFLKELLSLNFEKLDNSISAIVPRIYSNKTNRLLSPSKVFFDHIFVPSFFKKGIILNNISAFNSCSLFNVHTISKLKIFPNNFKLDMLDHYIYKIIYRNNYKVFQLDSFIMHSLSIENFEESITPDRYSSMVDSEFLLLKNSSILNKTIFSVRLIYRMIKQSFYSNKIFYKITFNKLIGK